MDHYKQALQVQDASNINGVVASLANEILPAVRDELRKTDSSSTYAVAHHPAVQLFVAKLIEMTSMGFADSEAYSIAYAQCQAATTPSLAAEV